MAVSPIPNTRQRRRILVGTEATRGTAATPTYRWYGDLVITKETPIVDREEYAGTYDVDYTPTFDPDRCDGTYAVPLSFQDFAILPRYAVKGGVAGVTDGEATPGYEYAYVPSPSTDDLDAATVEHGFDGIVWRSTGVMFNEFTVRGNINDAGAQWMWDGRLYVRSKDLQLGLTERAVSAVTGGSGNPHVITPAGGGLTIDALIGQYLEVMSGPGAGQVAPIADNDTTTITLDRELDPAPTTSSTVAVSGEFTAGIGDRTRDPINMAGTRLFVGDEGDTLGTDHQIKGRFQAFSVTVQNNINPKRNAEDLTGYSAKVDRGARRVTAQLTMEFDDWREVTRWEEHADRLVRIDQVNGPVIDGGAGTTMTARIDLPRLQWSTLREEIRNNNVLATYQGRGYVDAVAGYAFALAATIPDSTLP